MRLEIRCSLLSGVNKRVGAWSLCGRDVERAERSHFSCLGRKAVVEARRRRMRPGDGPRLKFRTEANPDPRKTKGWAEITKDEA